MDHHMRAIGKMTVRMEMDYSFTLMVQRITDLGKMTKQMDMVFLFIRNNSVTKDIGKMTCKKAKVRKYGLMAAFTQVHFYKDKKKDMVFIIGLMVADMKVIGQII
jgi:hypothetical protein